MSEDHEDELHDNEFEGLNNDAALDIIGRLIDTGFDRKSSNVTTRAFAMLDALEDRDLTAKQATELHYFRAN